jgi:hypothetical protein
MPLAEATEWLEGYRQCWEGNFQRLDELKTGQLKTNLLKTDKQKADKQKTAHSKTGPKKYRRTKHLDAKTLR